MALVCGPFCILRALAICHLACSFWISIIAFLMAAARYITKGNGASDLTIQGQALKTRSVGTRPSGPAMLLMALKAIYRAISLLISGISVIIIQQACHSGPQQRSTILMEFCDSTKTNFVVAPIVAVQYLNSLLIKFFLVSVVIKSSSPKQLLIQHI